MDLIQWQMLNDAKPRRVEAEQVLQDKEAQSKLAKTSELKDIKGVGESSIQKLNVSGIKTTEDLKNCSQAKLKSIGLSKIALIKLLEYKQTL